MKRITLADIAKECGVSVNTVSHALNDKPDISEQKKEEIKNIAEKMDYISNSAASFLRTGKSKSIGIIIGDIVNPSFSINIRLLENEFRKHGYSCMVFDSGEDEKVEKQAIIEAIGKAVDGIILCPSQRSEDNIHFLLERQIPFVLMGRRFQNVDTNYVICDDYDSGRQAAEYLIENNCKKIACLMMKTHVSSAAERLDGIKSVYKKNGLDLKKKDCYLVPGELTSRAAYMKQIIEKDYDGVICFSDIWALEFLSYVKRDIKVVSFDNIRTHFYVPCDLPSIGTKKEDFCHAILEVLLAAMKGQEKKVHMVFQTEIYH